jgi:hypothetical protein
MPTVLTDLVLATLPVVLLSAITWRLIWPRWKRAAKLLLHPCLYAVLALVIGHWSVAVAWVHQGMGLAGHVWFSKQHGFTWYAVEDPERYVALSKASVERWAQTRAPER